ncbi:hypothetical protein [Nocardioides sp.]|uniref:hypothetical protein n=1 Tax=Nocardioides sp. TaxID=35761 RepID=UPI0039E486F5
MNPTAELVVGDGPTWTARRFGAEDFVPSVFTSLPDAAETGMDIDTWRTWFVNAASYAILATHRHGYAIFYQTDRRHDGRLLSKAALVVEAAHRVGAEVVWHKIAVRRMSVDLFRPGYSHLIAVSVAGRAGKATPDVFKAGSKVYPNATDSEALGVALGFLDRQGIEAVADPYCGRGSIAWAASRRGMASWSVDIDPAQVDAAETLIAPHATILRAEGVS